jgi:hypothetical protein
LLPSVVQTHENRTEKQLEGGLKEWSGCRDGKGPISARRVRFGLSESELIYCVSRCSALYVDQPTFIPAVPDSAQELQLKVCTEAR